MATGSLLSDTLLAQFETMSRAPFRIMLVDLAAGKPSVQAIKRFAKKYPDRWAQALTQVAKLSGFNEKVEVEHHGTLQALVHEISQLSDAQLEAKYRAFKEPPKAIAADAERSDADHES